MRPASFYTRYFFLLGLIFVFPAYSQSRYTLESALKTARVNNPVLKTEQFYTGMAQADVTSAGLRPNIKLNNQTLQSANSRYFPENTSWNNSRNRQVWWQLTKTFQLPNQRQYKIDFARKQFGVAEKNYAETERNLYLQVANKWLDVWGTQMQLNLIRSAKNNVDSLAAINKLRLKNQVITQTDLMRTQLLASQYELQLKTVLQDYRNQLTELSFLVGAKDTVDIGSSDEFFSKADWINNMDSVFAQAARNRSDVQIALSTVALTDTNIKLQKSMAWPQPELGVISNPQNSVPYVGFYGTIELPFFDRNQGEIQKSRVMKQQAEQSVQTLKYQVRIEVTTAYTSFKVQQQNLTKYADLLKQAGFILDNVRYAYLRGGTTIIDFLEAQRSWLETQQQYYDTLQKYRQSYVQLLYATGLINQLAQ